MPELMVHLSDRAYTALERSAAERGKTKDQLIEESLEAAGVFSDQDLSILLAKARARSGLSEEEAIELAVAETRAVRRQRR
ncbi:MAG TPA: hypothetical protein VGG06_09640 [Thermoanaerobaculia bacterium]|jgi:hypothetical protein